MASGIGMPIPVFVYRNPGWYRMLGYEPHTLGNTVFTWGGVIHPDDLAGVMAKFDACLSGQASEYCAEYRCRCRDGSYLWIEDCGRIIERNPDGSVARMIRRPPRYPRQQAVAGAAGAAQPLAGAAGGGSYRRAGAAQRGAETAGGGESSVGGDRCPDRCRQSLPAGAGRCSWSASGPAASTCLLR